MLVVFYYPPNGGGANDAIRCEYPHHFEPKVLQCGTLKVYEPGEYDVPEFSSDDAKKPDEVIGKVPPRLVALFNGHYVVTWEGENDE